MSVFNRLLEISAYASVIVLAILLVRWLLGKRLSPALKYALWFVLIARLLLPLGLFLAAPDSITVLCGAPGAVSWTASPAKAVFDSAPSDAGAWNAMKASEIARARLAGGRVKLTFRKVAA